MSSGRPAAAPPFAVAASLAVLVLAVLVTTGTGCGPRKDPVRATLDAVVTAAEKHDAAGVVRNVTPDYQDASHATPAELELTLRRYLLAYESLRVTLSEVVIEGGPTRARATFRASFSGTPRAVGGLDAILPRSSTYRFDVLLVKDGNRFRIAKAAWSGE